MSQARRQDGSGKTRLLVAMIVVLGGIVAGRASVVRAAEVATQAGSLRLVPDDAAFYGAMLRNREQIEAIAHSKAWAKLKSLPLVQALWKKARTELHKPDGPMAQVHAMMQQPENQQLLHLLADMASDEIFFYGGTQSLQFMELAAKVSGAVQFNPALMKLGNSDEERDTNKLQAQAVLNALSANQDLIKTPDLVIGFRIRDRLQADAQFKRLEGLVKGLAQQVPPLKGRFRRDKETGFLVLTLDGSMVPWDRVPIKDMEHTPGEYDAVLQRLQQLKLTISLGVRDQYILLCMAETTAPITRLGKGNPLASRAELKPLEKFADRRLTSISYASVALNALVGSGARQVDDWTAAARKMLPKAKLTKPQQARMQKDLDALGRDLKRLFPEPGAEVEFSFLTDRGQEGYTYDYSKGRLHPDRPLTLLHHLGGAPLIASVGRSPLTREHYHLFVKWAKVGYRYFEEVGMPHMESDKREEFEALVKVALPLMTRLNEVTEESLLPALADSQIAFVLDAKIKSKQWVQLLPETAQALPMLEPALVVSVRDAAKLRKAFADYREIANELIVKLHELRPDDVPERKIPSPETRKLKHGDLYFYPLPVAGLLDEQILPNAGLSEHVAVLTISEKHTDRLLGNHPLKVEGGPLADPKRPLAEATTVDFAGMIDALKPWVELGVRLAQPYVQEQIEEGVGGDDGKKAADLLPQVRTLLDVLKVFRSYTSCTYVEDGVHVTHRESVIQDR